MKRAHKSDRRSLWSAVARDTAGELSEVIFRPGGATELSRWWSEAQPPGQIKEDFSRPGRDAGIALIGEVNRHFSCAPSGRDSLPARFRWLRFAPPPANVRRASGAGGVCQQYPERPHSK